jgi:hypothetical protein
MLRFLHVIGNKNEPDEMYENYNWLWKMRADIKQYIPNKHTHFEREMYELCDTVRYVYNMKSI